MTRRLPRLALAAFFTLAASGCTAGSDAPDMKADNPVRVGGAISSDADADLDANSATQEGLERKRDVAEKPPLDVKEMDGEKPE